MIVAFTGHRPNKLNNEYDGKGPISSRIKAELTKELKRLAPAYCITGMALGVDQLAAEICIELNIPFIAAVPCDDQEKVWPNKSQVRYKEILSKAKEVVIVSPGAYYSQCMQVRNIYMVDRADVIIGVHDGSKGGTYNCLEYARSKGKEVRIISLR